MNRRSSCLNSGTGCYWERSLLRCPTRSKKKRGKKWGYKTGTGRGGSTEHKVDQNRYTLLQQRLVSWGNLYSHPMRLRPDMLNLNRDPISSPNPRQLENPRVERGDGRSVRWQSSNRRRWLLDWIKNSWSLPWGPFGIVTPPTPKDSNLFS